ncbi:MAG: YjbH domain-containing protein [Alphaproteobacteria bacterium]
MQIRKTLTCIAAINLAALAYAYNSYAQAPPPAAHPYSTNAIGMLGLNTIPSARMDKSGTVRLNLGATDPYLHGALGFQIADPLYINVRQSGEMSTFDADPKRVYPGIDLKLRLMEENKTRPQIALGLQSAIGHKRMSGEYIATSKRYNNFDFTAGIGWGRFAGAAHIDNPLGALGGHFDRNRDIDGANPARAADWFTGQKIGFFGGIEYFPPFLKGLSLKADIGGNRYEAEKTAFDFNAPPPYSVGLNYRPPQLPYLDLSLAAQGKDRFMGRISFQGNIKNIRDQNAKDKSTAFMRPYRSDFGVPAWMTLAAQKDKMALLDTVITNREASARLPLAAHLSTPHQLGRAAMHIANHAGQTVEALTIAPTSYGLRGASITFMRHDLERALAHDAGSAEEIWHNAEFKHNFNGIQKLRYNDVANKPYPDISLTLDNQIGLSEEDDGFLFRNAAIVELMHPDDKGLFTSAFGLRFNLAENLHKLDKIRPQTILPVRSDIDDFADRFVSVEKSFGALTHTIAPDLHIMSASGYLEEMYAGIGGETLYRPFDKRFAIGGEAWLALKRDPHSVLNLGLTGDHLISGHINAWYDIPELDLTLNGKFGRYLAEDIGATLALSKNFKNGASLSGYVTMTDNSEPDLFGGEVHFDHGIKLSVPLGGYIGGYKYAPHTRLNLTTAPFGRDLGQSLKNPLPLYDLSTPLSKSHYIQNWKDITNK